MRAIQFRFGFALVLMWVSLLASCGLFSPEDKESNTWPVIEDCDTIGVVDSFENGSTVQRWALSVANYHGRLFALGKQQLHWVNDSGKFEAVPNQQWQYRNGPLTEVPVYMDHANGWKPQFFWFDDSLLISDGDQEAWRITSDLPTLNWWKWGATAGTNDDRTLAAFAVGTSFVSITWLGTIATGDHYPSGEKMLRPLVQGEMARSSFNSACWLHRSMPFAIGDTIYSDSCGHSYYTVNRNTAEVVHHPSPMADTNVVYFFPNAGRLCAMHLTGAYCRNESTGSWVELEFGSSFKAYLSERDGREISVNVFLESDSVTILSLATGSNIALVQNGKIVMRKISNADSQGDGPVNNMTIWNNQFVFTGKSGYILSLPLDEVLSWKD